LRCQELDPGVDVDAIPDHLGHDRPGQRASRRVSLDLGQLPLQDGRRGSLAEVRLEHRREGDPTSRPKRSNPVRRASGGGARH